MSFPPFRPLRNENDFSLLESKLEDSVYLKIFQKMIKNRCKKSLPKLSLLFNDIYLSEFNLTGICGKKRLLDTRIYDVYFELMLEKGVNADEVNKYAQKEIECIKGRIRKRRQYRNKQNQNALQPIALNNQTSSPTIVQHRKDIEHNYVSKSEKMSSYTVNIIVDVPKEGLELKKELNFLIESVKDVHQNLFFAVNVDKHCFDCINCNQKYVLNLVHEENVSVRDDNNGFEDDISVKEEVLEEEVFEEEVESWPISIQESVSNGDEWENTKEVKDERISLTSLGPRSKPDLDNTPSLPPVWRKCFPVFDSKGEQIRLYTINPPRIKLPTKTNSEQFSQSLSDGDKWENTKEVKDEQIPLTSLAPLLRPEHGLVESTPSLLPVWRKCFPVSDSKGEQIRLYTINPPRFKLPTKTNSEQFSQSFFKDEQIPNRRSRYRCEICGKRFFYQSILNNHNCPKGTTHQSQTLDCTMCNKTFSKEDSFREHLKEFHKQEQSLVCHLCGLRFTKNSELKYHLNDSYVHQERLYECHYCSKKFFTKSIVARHIERHFPSLKKPQDPITCQICAQSFKAASYLRRHLRTVHEGHKPHQCHLCAKQFTTGNYLKIHIGLHQNGNKYPCKFCKVTYRDPGTVACHMRKTHPIEYEVYKNNKKLAVYE